MTVGRGHLSTTATSGTNRTSRETIDAKFLASCVFFSVAHLLGALEDRLINVGRRNGSGLIDGSGSIRVGGRNGSGSIRVGGRNGSGLIDGSGSIHVDERVLTSRRYRTSVSHE